MSAPPAPKPAPSTAPVPTQRRPVRGSDLLLILIVSMGAVRLLGMWIHGAARWLGPGDEELALLAMVGAFGFQILIQLAMIYAVAIRHRGLSWAELGLRPARVPWTGRAVLIAIGLIPVLALINGVLLPKVTGAPFENPQIHAIAPIVFTWFGALAMGLLGGLAAPFVEELAFRGLFYPWLRQRLGIPMAVALSALCFAVLHGIPQLIPGLFVIGAVLAMITQRSGSLWPAIVTHGLFNLITILTLYAVLATGVELPS